MLSPVEDMLTSTLEIFEDDEKYRQVVPSPIQSQGLPLLKTNIVLNSMLLDQGMSGGFLSKRIEEIDAVQDAAVQPVIKLVQVWLL